jgi:predicted acylesterase/phospholipase RssA
MLRVVLERDVRPDLIVATSVRAVNGAFLASHGATAETVEELADVAPPTAAKPTRQRSRRVR